MVKIGGKKTIIYIIYVDKKVGVRKVKRIWNNAATKDGHSTVSLF